MSNQGAGAPENPAQQCMVKYLFAFLLTGAALLMGMSVFAHHSAAIFDHQKQVTLSGTVKEFQFTNPHCWIQLLVSTGDVTAEWSIELGSPAHLLRAGWKRNTLNPGDKITVVVNPLREGTNGGGFVSAMRPDGTPIGAPL